MRKLKVVMIGAGERANQVIYPAFSHLENVEILGICDIDIERLNKTADKYGIANRYGSKGVYDYQKMIHALKPDAVAAVGQPHIMYDIWKWCLENNLHLFIEKPFSLTMHQAISLESIAVKNNLVTQVGFQRRYTPMVAEMREECLKRGDITHALCKFYKYEIKDFTGARDHMMDDCVHSIDTLRWICSSEVTRVESFVRRIDTVDINLISAMLYFENGAIGHLINNWSSGKRIFAVEMHSMGIFAEAEHETKGYLYKNGDLDGIEYTASGSAGSDEFYIKTGVLASVTDFVNCCLTGGQPMCCFSDAIKTMKIAEIILAQALLSGK